MIRSIILSLGYIIVYASVSFAAPSISSVSGTVTNGQPVTVSGTNFGTKAQAAPVKFEQFEVKDGGGAPTTSHRVAVDMSTFWTDPSNNTNGLTISSQNQRSSNSLYNASGYYHQTDGALPDQSNSIWTKNAIGASSTKKLYVNFWVKFKWPTIDYQGNLNQIQHKSWNLAQAFGSTGFPDYPGGEISSFWWMPNAGLGTTDDYTESHVTLQRNGANLSNQYDNSNQNNILHKTIDGWVNMSMVIGEGDTDTANAYMKSYLTKESSPYSTAERASFIWLDNGDTTYFDYMKFGFYDEGKQSGAGGNKGTFSTTQYFDDIYIDNSWARVEIGDNAVYDSCTHREIQPATAWADNSITITANIGSYTIGSTVYVFVCDDNNSCSGGQPVNIGAIEQTSAYSTTGTGSYSWQ